MSKIHRVQLFCPQIWRFISRRATPHPGCGPQRHPQCFSPAGTNAQHHRGDYSCVVIYCVEISRLKVIIISCCLQGYYSRLALRDFGTFLRYMESEFNIKVGVSLIEEWFFPQISQRGRNYCMHKHSVTFISLSCDRDVDCLLHVSLTHLLSCKYKLKAVFC